MQQISQSQSSTSSPSSLSRRHGPRTSPSTSSSASSSSSPVSPPASTSILFVLISPVALLSLDQTSITITSLLLTQTSFFALGNSNAISSIDLSNSYNGIASYNIAAVALLVFASNWAGPIYWSSAAPLLLGGFARPARNIAIAEVDSRDWIQQEREYLERLARAEDEVRKRRDGGEAWGRHAALVTLWSGTGLVAVMAACTLLRQHLFIWTVFSPKFLYAMAWGIAWHFGVGLGLAGALWWAGGW